MAKTCGTISTMEIMRLARSYQSKNNAEIGPLKPAPVRIAVDDPQYDTYYGETTRYCGNDGCDCCVVTDRFATKCRSCISRRYRFPSRLECWVLIKRLWLPEYSQRLSLIVQLASVQPDTVVIN